MPGENDLLEELNQATEDAERQATYKMKPDDGAIEQMINSEMRAEFEEDAKEKENSQSSTASETTDGPDATDQPAPEPPPISKEKARSIASRYVRGFNALMKVTMPSLYRSKILKKGDQQIVAEYISNKEDMERQGVEDLTKPSDKILEACRRYQKLEKAIEDLSFTDEEKELLVEDLSEVIPKYKWMQMGPEASLFWTVAMIMLPRIEPLFPGVHKFFAKMGEKE